MAQRQRNLKSPTMILQRSILSKKYYQEKEEGWEWFEDNLTYGNSILPEALLYAHLSTKNSHFKAIAKKIKKPDCLKCFGH